jgi:hypothetical protein
MKRICSILLIPLVFLAACDGEPGFSGDAAPPPVPGAGAFAIDSGNAVAVTGVAYKAALASGELAGLADSNGLTADAGGVNKTAFSGKVGGVVTQSVPIPLGPQPCLLDGEVEITLDVVDPAVFAAGMYSAGDTIHIEYRGCIDVQGETIDGVMDLEVISVEGDLLGGVFNLTMSIVATNLQVTTPDDVLSIHGDVTASINTLNAPFVRASVSGERIETSSNASSEILTAFDSLQTVDGGLNPIPYTMSAGGTLDSSQLPGIVDYSTPVTFQGLGENYPHTGEFLVVSGNSSALLIAIDDVNVQIDIDNNRDGTVDETIMTTWAELLAS